MAEPPLSAAASLVRRFDPALFRTALFAPEPGRERLMTLYALDIELSRALSVTAEPMIALMRLQFWRDVLAEAGQGGAPRAHEVAGPLHALLAERPLPPALPGRLIDAREMELDGLETPARFDDWAEARFSALVQFAGLCLVGPECADRLAQAARPAGRALGRAFALRTAVPMAADGGRPLLTGIAAPGLAALVRGQTDPALCVTVRGMAEAGLSQAAEARAQRAALPRQVAPAFLPLAAAEATFRAATRSGGDLAALALRPPEARLATFWRALSGRW